MFQHAFTPLQSQAIAPRIIRGVMIACWLLGWQCSLLNAAEVETTTPLFPQPVLSTQAEQTIFPGSQCSPAEQVWGPTIQDFSVASTRTQFPNCPMAAPSWDATCCNLAEDCAGESGCISASAVRCATWYVDTALVPLRRDPQHRANFARQGSTSNSPFVLTSQGFDYPFDAGMAFTLGRRLSDRFAVEGSYLGSYSWRDSRFVRNSEPNTQASTGNLFSPFTNFGAPAVVGLDFNNFAQVDTSATLESVEINVRYRGDLPRGPWDVSFLYGVRYLHIGETLRYHTESAVPAALGTQNTEFVSTGNDMIGAQLGIAGHYLFSQRSWFNVDLKGGLYSNQAKQATVYELIDNTGTFTAFNTAARRIDTAFSGDVRLLWNYQFLPRFTVQTGYQATWVASVATAVDNFQTDINSLRFGPGLIRTNDTVAYHGPVLGVIWVR
jgi:hypothetical protein